MKLARVLPLCVAVVAPSFLSIPCARAGETEYTLEGTFYNSQVPSSISNGDGYTLSFDLDTSAVNVGSGQNGVFLNAVSNLSFELDAGSTGNYAGGTMAASQFLQLTDNFDGFDLVNFYASSAFVPTGLDFSPAGSDPFVQFSINLYSSNPNTFSLAGGTGQTLDSVLPTLNLASYDNTAEIELVFGDWNDPQRADANITSMTTPTSTSVPDGGATIALLGCAFSGLAAFSRRLKK